MNPTELKKAIEEALSHPSQLSSYEGAIRETIQLLDTGKIRVAEKTGDEWITHAWIKNAILLYFKISPMSAFEVGPYSYYDKIPLKTNFKELNVRIVPPAVARIGTFMEAGVVLMPSYVNIGAYIGSGTMVDTWATVGSCGQIGKNVHLSGGVGIGGVLEPASATPVIVEDNAFIGSRAIIVEGVRVGHDAVIAANVTLTASTPIIDVRTSEHKVMKGFVPPGSVVVPGTREKEVSGGKIQLACAYIIGNRKESTDKKTSLNEVLREFALSV